MSEFVQGKTKGGGAWTPKFVEDLNQKACIGCGRCFKVCPQGVLNMIGITEDGDIVDAQDDDAEKNGLMYQPPPEQDGIRSIMPHGRGFRISR